MLEIIGVTSTKLTFSVGFSYLEHEREENFKWALEKLKELFSSDKLLSNVVVTGRELALMNAIEVVFPNLTHLLCSFHIPKNVSMKCKEYVKSESHEYVMDLWNNFMYTNRETEFITHLEHFQTVCADIPLFVKYVIKTWLTPYKERFVVASNNRVTYLANTTTNKVESSHCRLKNTLTTNRGDLCQSWDDVNTMLKLKLGSTRVSFQKSITNIEHRYNSLFCTNLHSFVSRQCI